MFSIVFAAHTLAAQAYDVGWFQGLVHLAEPATFSLYCIEGLGAHGASRGGRL